MFLQKFIGVVQVILLVGFFTACGSGTPNQIDVSKNKIEAYASNSNNSAPLLSDYVTVGVIGLSEEDVTQMNIEVAALEAEDVDTLAELQAIADAITHPPVVATLANSAGTIAENAATGASVGTVTVTDTGDSPITAITLSGSGHENFAVSTTGAITVNAGASLDYESITSYNLTAIATNGAGDSASVDVNITVTDVADVVATLANSAGTIAENAATGASVGTVTVTDTGDSPITAITLSGSGHENFAVSTTGAITVNAGASLDYESITSYNLTAIATNGAGDSASVDVNITVTDVADVVATLAVFTGSIEENATVGTELGTVTVTDSGDSPITTFTLNDSTNFEINASGTIKTKTALDYETSTIHNLTVTATNGAGESASVNVTINITDVADVVPMLEDFTGTIDGNSSANTIVGVIHVLNAGDTPITAYALSDTSMFDVDATGTISTKSILDTATASEYNMTIIATNTAGDSIATDVNITITKSPQSVLTVLNNPVVQTVGDSLIYNTTGGSGSGALVFGSAAFVDASGTLTATGSGVVSVYRDGKFNYQPSLSAEYNVTAISRPSFDLDGNDSGLIVATEFDVNSHIDMRITNVIIDDDATYPLTYELEMVGVPYGSSLSKTIVGGSFTPDVDGRYIVSVVLNDGISGHTKSLKKYMYLDTILYTGTNTIDTMPVANGGSDLVEASVGSEIVLDGIHSAVTKGSIGFLWEFVAKPSASGASLTDASTSRARFTPDVEGVYIVKLSVSDGTDTSTDSIQVYTTGDMTDVSGDISSDTNWTRENSPYNLTGHVNVSAKLLIEKGTVVLGNSYILKLDTDATLLDANGTQDYPVAFDSLYVNAKNNKKPDIQLKNIIWDGGSYCHLLGNSGANGYRNCEGGITILDSILLDSFSPGYGQWTHIWYPKRPVNIRRNIFARWHGLNIGIDGRYSATHRFYAYDNVWYSLKPDRYSHFNIEMWANYGYTAKVNHNTLINATLGGTPGYSSSTFDALYNHFPIRNISTILDADARVLPVITNESTNVPDHRKYTPYDADADGIDDKVDNCPSSANPSQADADGDGIGDACTP